MQYVGRLVSGVYNTIPAMNINPATLSGAIDIIVVERQVEIEAESDDDDNDHSDAGSGPEGHEPAPSPSDDGLSVEGGEEQVQGPPPGWPRGLVWHPPPPPPPDPLSPPAFEVPDLMLSPPLRPTSPGSPSLAPALELDEKDTARRSRKAPSKKKTKVVTELSSTPFHVRFGKMSVMRPAERRVTLHLNNHPEPLPFVMKVGNEGEAFFVFETDADDPSIPPEMVTSPVLSAASSPLLPPVQNEDITFVPPADGEYEDEDTPRHSRSPSLDDLDLGEAQAPPLESDTLDAQLDEFVQTTSHHHRKRRDRFNRITSEHGEPYTFDMDGYKLTADGENMAAEEGRRLAAEMHFKPNSRHARARMHRSHSKDGPPVAAEGESTDGDTSDDDSDEELDQSTQIFVSDLIQCAQHLRQSDHHDNEAQPDAELIHAPNDEHTLRLVHQGRVHEFQLSLAGAEGVPPADEADGRKVQEARDAFAAHQVSYDQFLDDASIASDERLVVAYDGRYLLWEDHSALLAALSLYRRSLQSVERLSPRLRATTEPPSSLPAKTSRWSRWWSRAPESPPPESVTSEEGRGMERAKSEPLLDGYQRPSSPSDSGGEEESAKVYLKTLRLTSDQLKMMNLRKGHNTITFSVTSSFSGVAVVRARIFLWDASQPIVVSDIDGTITKSDALGHMFTLIGRDWTHQGVAKLFTDITSNGYRIMYLTSRAIGQADTTRDYLRGIKQDGFVLPEGPVIMSPDRLMASLHREVILRKPEVFKMAALRDIARLFGNEGHSPPDAQEEEETLPDAASPGPSRSRSPSPPPASPTSPPLEPLPSPLLTPRPGPKGTTESTNPTPFYAGFGNRITDALSYRSVDIPSSRIFTIDPNGEVKMELLEMAGYNTSYIHMTDLVDQMFPIVKSGKKDTRAQRQFNDFNYWRAPLPDVHLPEVEPASPALSATGSIRSNRSTWGEPASPQGQGQGREGRSRFSLLGRIASSSVSTLPTPQDLERSTPPPELASSPSPSSSSLWTAPWRRRGASPQTSTEGASGTAAAPHPSQRDQRATSPLVAPALTAEPEEEDVSDLDEDVLRQPGGHRRMLSQESRRSRATSVPPVEEGDRSDGDGDEDGPDDGEEEDGELLSEEEAGSEEDEDPLLTQGEIRFEWHG